MIYVFCAILGKYKDFDFIFVNLLPLVAFSFVIYDYVRKNQLMMEEIRSMLENQGREQVKIQRAIEEIRRRPDAETRECLFLRIPRPANCSTAANYYIERLEVINVAGENSGTTRRSFVNLNFFHSLTFHFVMFNLKFIFKFKPYNVVLNTR